MGWKSLIVPAMAFLAIGYSSFAHTRNAGPVPQITLKEEYLAITLKQGPAMHVTVDFHFSGGSLSGMELAFPEDDRTRYKNFQAFMVSPDGAVNLPVARKAAPPDHLFDFRVARYPALYRMKVPDDNKTMHHRVSYDADLPPYFRQGSKGELPSGYVVHYILITGSTWKGDVDVLKIEVDPGPYKCRDLVPTERSISGACGTDGKWRQEAKNHELLKDVELVLKIGQD